MGGVFEFRATSTVQPGGLTGRAFRRLSASPTQKQRLAARKAGFSLDPQTGRNLGTIFTGVDAASVGRKKARQDRLFAQLTGATACQLGVGIKAGNPALAVLTKRAFLSGGEAGCADTTQLRPQQLAALKAGGSPDGSIGVGGSFQPTGSPMGATVPASPEPAGAPTPGGAMAVVIGLALVAAVLTFRRK